MASINYKIELFEGLGGTLNLQNLIQIKEAMDKIVPLDQSDHFKVYHKEITDRIERLVKRAKNLSPLQH